MTNEPEFSERSINLAVAIIAVIAVLSGYFFMNKNEDLRMYYPSGFSEHKQLNQMMRIYDEVVPKKFINIKKINPVFFHIDDRKGVLKSSYNDLSPEMKKRLGFKDSHEISKFIISSSKGRVLSHVETNRRKSDKHDFFTSFLVRSDGDIENTSYHEAFHILDKIFNIKFANESILDVISKVEGGTEKSMKYYRLRHDEMAASLYGSYMQSLNNDISLINTLKDRDKDLEEIKYVKGYEWIRYTYDRQAYINFLEREKIDINVKACDFNCLTKRIYTDSDFIENEVRIYKEFYLGNNSIGITINQYPK